MKSGLFGLLLAMLLLGACSKDDHTAIPPLPGAWQETEQPIQFAGNNYHFVFTATGSFQIQRHLFTDIVEPGRSCGDSRTQYMRGSYSVAANQLILSGKYCDSSFTTDVPDCAAGADFSALHSLRGNFGQLILDDEKGDFKRIILNRE